MAAVLLGIVALILLLWALNAFTRTDPKVAARVLKTSAGTAALAGAVIFVALGRVGIALPLGIAGLALLGLWPGGIGFAPFAQGASGGGYHQGLRSMTTMLKEPIGVG